MTPASLQRHWRAMLYVNAAVMLGVFLYKLNLQPYVPYIHLLVDYHFGFIKRALIGALVSLFTAKVPVWLVFALGGVSWLVTLGLFVQLFRRTFGLDRKHMPLFVLIAGSPFFFKNFMHTLGHFDIYGCLFAIILLLLPARSIFFVLLAALLSAALVLIHHIHLLLYVPTIIVIVFIRHHLVTGLTRANAAIGIASVLAIGALFVASVMFSHTPIAEPAARSVPGTFAAVPAKVMPPGAVCRFVVVAESPVEAARPCVIVFDGSADSLTARHFDSALLLTVKGASPRWQFCHLDDLVGALELAISAEVTGAFAVGCDGWLERDDVERISGLRRIELPASLTFGTAQRLHRMGITPGPVNDLQYLVYPWVVDCQTLREAGWRPAFDNATVLQELMEARATHRAAGRRLPRKEATITAAGATVAVNWIDWPETRLVVTGLTVVFVEMRAVRTTSWPFVPPL